MKEGIKTLDQVFSFFVLVTILLLACYMAVRIGTQGMMFLNTCNWAGT